MDKKIIGVFCGSFNPPLNSHFSLAQQLLNENIEKIIFVPVSSKYNKSGLASDKHRLQMLKLVCNKNPDFEVSDIELNTEAQPYTIDTMKKIQLEYPENEVRLIMGTDNLKELETWHEVEELLKQFKVILLLRDEDNTHEIIKMSKTLSKYRSSFIENKITLRTNLSSTFVRELIKQNKKIKYLLPEEIIEYIEQNNLYKE